MTLPLLRRSRLSWLVVSGADKATMFAHALQGANFREVPAASMNQSWHHVVGRRGRCFANRPPESETPRAWACGGRL